MRKELLIFYAALLCLAGLASSPAWGQVTVTAPTANSTVVSPVTISGVAPLNTSAIRVRYKNAGQGNFNNAPVQFFDALPGNFSVSMLIPAGARDIEVLAVNAGFNAIGAATVVSNVTVQAPAGPVVTIPASGATGLDPCGFTVNVADYPDASAVRVQWRRINTNQQNFSTNTRFIVDTESPFSVDIEEALRENQQYELRVTAGFVSGGTFVEATAATLLTVTTGQIPVTAQITAPANGAQGVSVFPTFTADVVETGSCGQVTQARLQIATDAAFTTIVQTLPYIAAPGPYEWTPTTALANSTTYFVRLQYTTQLDGRNTSHSGAPISFTTVGPLVVTNPPLPFPTVNPGVSVCGLIVTADAYAGTDYLEIRYVEGVQNQTFNWNQGAITSTQVTAFPDAANGSFAVAVPGNNVQPFNSNATYTLRIRALTDEGVVLGTVFRVIQTGDPVSYTPVFGPEEVSDGAVVVPVDGSANVSLVPTFRVGAFQGCPGIFLNARIEVDLVGPATDPNSYVNNANFAAPGYQIYNFSNSETGPYTFTFPTTLNASSVYQARFTFITSPGQPANQTVIRFTTGDFLGVTQVIAFMEGNMTVPFVNGAYRNALTQTFVAQDVAGAAAYDWQFDDDPSFASPIEVLVQPRVFTFNATNYGFVSGAQYYVRVRARNPVRPGVYPAPGSPAIVNYYHPLFAPIFTSPTTLTLDRRRFSIKSTVVPNATHYFFQIAKANPANDANPAADFVEGNYFQNPVNFPQSAISSFTLANGGLVEPVVNPGGSLFMANNIKQWDWGLEAIFGFLQAQPQTTYRMRVVAARQVNGEFVQQTDIDLVPITTFGTNGIPDRAHPIMNIADGAVNVQNRESQSITRIVVKGVGLFWDISEYQLQVSEIPFTDNSTSQGTVYSIGGVTEYDPHFFVPNLKFGTRYYVRARSIGTEDGVTGVPSPWTDPVPGGVQEGISFTTMGMPAPGGIDLRNITSNRAAVVSVGRVGVADRYEWTLERTSAPAATYPVKVTNWVNATFGEYLVQGASYKLSVRAFHSTQAGDPAGYSAPVTATFTVNSDAARSSNEPAMAGTEELVPSVLFPNPFQRETSLQINTSYEQVQVRAVNAQGKVMLDKQASGGETVVLGAGWPSGVYVIQLLNGQGLGETFRIVKQ